MARARTRARPRVAGRPTRSVGRRRGGSTALDSIGSVLFRLEAIGIALLVVALISIPALVPATRGVTDLRDGFVRTFGLLVFAFIGLLVYFGFAALRRQANEALATWKPWVIGGLIALFIGGLLGFFRPEWRLGDVLLSDVTAGGDLGHLLAGTPLGIMAWLAAGVGAFALISPEGAQRSAQSAATGARTVWDWRLPQRAVVAARAIVDLIFPTRTPPEGAEKVPLDTVIWAQQAEPEAPATSPRGTASGAGHEAAIGGEPVLDAGEQQPLPIEGEDGEETGPGTNGASRKAHDGWQLPTLELLRAANPQDDQKIDNAARARLIIDTLSSFGVDAKIVQVNEGPTVTQFALEPGWEVKTRQVPERDASGRPIVDDKGKPKTHAEEVSRTRVRVNQITALSNDLALALAAPSLRIESPVPGKPFVGLEVPNHNAALVTLRGVIESAQFRRMSLRSRLTLALGESVAGEPVVADLSKMPHLLIAGSTGSGKSVCINAIIACVLMHASPEEVRFVMIDPKRVELSAFGQIPHLAFSSIITDMDQVVGTLQAVLHEMESRYRRFSSLAVRNIESYNEHPSCPSKLPYWMVIVDELADLMMAAPYEVERQICRLAQLARATGIHLVLATQRPSVDVVTGLIKANFPTRIAFAMSSQVDSRTILDTSGAEKLLGRGDMLYLPTDASKPRRLQGVYVSDQEIEQLVDFWTEDRFQDVDREVFDHLIQEAQAKAATELETENEDPMVTKAIALARDHRTISTSMLQRRLRIGYPRAARVMDMLEEQGVVGPAEGTGSREVRLPVPGLEAEVGVAEDA